MTTGSKVWMIVLFIAGMAMIAVLVMLLTGTFGTSSNVDRADIDLETVGKKFEEKVQATSELAGFAESINKDQLYEGEGKLKVEMAADGSILGWVDKNNDNQPTLYHSLDDSANKELNEPESPEVVFWIRAEKGEKRLVLTDRYRNAYEHDVSENFRQSEVWRSMLAQQYAYYGEEHWRAPRFWVFVVPGYYGRYSSARSSSLGRRAGAGGIGGGK